MKCELNNTDYQKEKSNGSRIQIADKLEFQK
jgi:hypothetical protein